MTYSVEDIHYVESCFNRFFDIGTTPCGGVTRLGYTKAEDQMHQAFSSLAKEAGFFVTTDQVGNTFACNKVSEKASYYLIGSHLDSVVDGGRYDGVVGVLAGLLIMRWAKLDGLKIPIRTGAFRCEESSNFGVSTLGSELVTHTGHAKDYSTLIGKNGQTLGEIFAEKGYNIKSEPISGIKEYLEVHIEQGKVLEEYKQRVGIVTTIAGPRRFRIHIQGKAEHSGATPMVMRTDALCAAAEFILEAEKIGTAESMRNSVVTVGVVKNSPNALNVIPGEVTLEIDTRAVEPESLNEMEKRIRSAIRSICTRRGVTYLREKIGESKPVDMDHKMQDKLARAALHLDISHRRMMSGAGHDAMKFADICDTAMIFIPCRDGISHNKNEFTHMESICDGARVIYEYLKEECTAK